MARRVRITAPFDYVPQLGRGAVRGMRTFEPGEHLMPEDAAAQAIAGGYGTPVGEEQDEALQASAGMDAPPEASPHPPETTEYAFDPDWDGSVTRSIHLNDEDD